MERMKAIDINERGLAMFVGTLEAAVMRAIWAGNSTSAKIWRYVRENYTPKKTEDEIAYTSVTSTLLRLFKQDYLTRAGDKTAGYIYTPVCATETEFVNRHIRVAFDALFDSYPREAGQAVVEFIRASQASRALALTKE